MRSFAKSTWGIPAGLVILSLLPLSGGAHRITELISGAQITRDNARFFAAPLPIVLHVISCSIYFVLGAFQFSSGVRSNSPKWHRAAGRILIPAGLASAATGMWMAVVYPPVFGDGTALTFIRLLVGSAIMLSICSGIRRNQAPRLSRASRVDDARLCACHCRRHTAADTRRCARYLRHRI